MTWNVKHKTSEDEEGPDGYPDPGYLDRVTEELNKMGVTSQEILDEGQRHKLRSWNR